MDKQLMQRELGGWWRSLSLAVAVLGVAGLVAVGPGCENEGPAEEAGEAVDDAADDVGDAVDDTID